MPAERLHSLARVEIDCSTLMICYMEWSHAVLYVTEKKVWNYFMPGDMDCEDGQ